MTTDNKISALHEILKWSSGRPDWQRDALRRIVLKGTLSEADINELYWLCKAEAEKPKPDPPIKVEPLNASHLPPKPGSETSVSLVSVGNMKNVNRLPSDQIIPFGPTPGLTVIYGDNGTGKSGYARVIKKACRTRGDLPKILPDTFVSSANPEMATCTIVCRVGGSECPVPWKDSTNSDPRLANVFVFDTSTASHYLGPDSPAAFTPFGLDVLPKLSKASDAIAQRLKQDIVLAKTGIEAASKAWKYNATTSVGKLLSGLCATTKEAEVDKVAGLDETQNLRLKEISDALKSDPKQKARETRAAVARIRTFAQKIKDVFDGLSDDRASNAQKAVEEASSTQQIAKTFAEGWFDATFMPGTGSDLWKTLWEAARNFSVAFAYEGKSFPVVDGEARCVLCQQTMNPDTVDRFRVFDEFCKHKSQEMAQKAGDRLKAIADQIEKIDTLGPEYLKVETDLSIELESEQPRIAEFVKKCDERLTALKNSLNNGTWTDLTSIPESPFKGLELRANQLETRACTEESADDPETRKKLQAERDELSDRAWLGEIKADVFSQITRLKDLASLEVCLKDTQTAQITSKNTDLTKLLVTDVFCGQFTKEAKTLGLRTLAVKLEEVKGAKGETKFGLRLHSGAKHAVKEIASEGEQRCIALAAFLAELSQASHQSALVFDDPVSSFDHTYREKTAMRLAEEGKVRQVIVFTHDVVFLNDLQVNAERLEVPTALFHLEWNNGVPGQCIEGLPWDWKNPKDRFDKLEKEQRRLKKTWNPVPNDENVLSMRQVYSWIRATLERIVEKEVFADVVFRYRSYINVGNLNRVIGFSDKECREIQRLIKRCHDVTEAHDPAGGKQGAVPDPDELKDDIEAVKLVVEKIRTRQKNSAAQS